MGMKEFLYYTALPAAVGAASGYVGQKLGYDISAVEGMKQLVMAGLPLAVISASTTPYSETDLAISEYFRDKLLKKRPSPNLPLVTAAVNAAGLAVGGLAMKLLTNQSMNIGFISAAGAIEGALLGAGSYVKRMRNIKRDE